ncbi:MAG: hypothetical protein AUH85_00425 [Chloroflexi bacterium 13_1_40CM_4_68_4]|nr:MAG: hypothetical protein AUH85_00425 [Chloroflexi bacterium 13_1_40CM_4_68_4]
MARITSATPIITSGTSAPRAGATVQPIQDREVRECLRDPGPSRVLGVADLDRLAQRIRDRLGEPNVHLGGERGEDVIQLRRPFLAASPTECLERESI